MNKLEKFFAGVAAAFLVGAIVLGVLSITPFGRAALNRYGYAVQKADDATRYETKKKWRIPAVGCWQATRPTA